MSRPVCSLSPDKTLISWDIVSNKASEAQFLGSAGSECASITQDSFLESSGSVADKVRLRPAPLGRGMLLVVATAGKDVVSANPGVDLVCVYLDSSSTVSPPKIVCAPPSTVVNGHIFFFYEIYGKD